MGSGATKSRRRRRRTTGLEPVELTERVGAHQYGIHLKVIDGVDAPTDHSNMPPLG